MPHLEMRSSRDLALVPRDSGWPAICAGLAAQAPKIRDEVESVKGLTRASVCDVRNESLEQKERRPMLRLFEKTQRGQRRHRDCRAVEFRGDACDIQAG